MTSTADLWRDFKIEGDVVDALFLALQDECGPLDMRDLQFERHFEMNEPPWTWDWFGTRRKKFMRERTPVKVADIETWVETRRWPIRYD